MKIVIEHGTTLEKAVEYLKKFAEENCNEYNILQGDMDIYLSLKNETGDEHPCNENNYKLSEPECINVERDLFQEEYKKAFLWLIEQINKVRKKYTDIRHTVNQYEEKLIECIINNSDFLFLDKIERNIIKYSEEMEIQKEEWETYEILYSMIKNKDKGYKKAAIPHYDNDNQILGYSHFFIFEKGDIKIYFSWCAGKGGCYPGCVPDVDINYYHE